MKFFVKNSSIQLIDQKSALPKQGHIFVRGSASTQQVFQYYESIMEGKVKGLADFVFVVPDLEAAKAEVLEYFTLIKAAGGLVEKEGQLLCILRNGLWDLPKGKAEKGELPEVTACREVEEECGVKVASKGFAAESWHTYRHNDKEILKLTSWFYMDCLDDQNMQPQAEEGIEEVKWTTRELLQSLVIPNTYRSVADVVSKYFVN